MKKLERFACVEGHPIYDPSITREDTIYTRENDLRTPFGRDYTRLIFSQGYRRMKHKTQVFFAINNDHICTRNEHVNLVESVSYTIAKELGLNTELTKAIAVGHDIGHAPFGHGGERILSDIASSHHLDKFWHEKNSLHFVDSIELLEDDHHNYHNLSLTYAVRDGIISHCGELNQKKITPRSEKIDLNTYHHPGEYEPYTYEGCVVKMSDKIAYLARDIEDALSLHIITDDDLSELLQDINAEREIFTAINNGTVVNYFILDVIENSDEEGIGLSKEAHTVMKKILSFNYSKIYMIKKVDVHTNYVSLILHSVFDFLYDYKTHIQDLYKDKKNYPSLLTHYLSWLEKYGNCFERDKKYKNHIVYDFNNDTYAYEKSILDYLSGMTDAFLIQVFNELLTF